MKTIATEKWLSWIPALMAMFIGNMAWAHDPIFGIGPHVVYQGGVEIAPEVHTKKRGDDQQSELGIELTYGLTGDWAVSAELPYARNKSATDESNGLGDASLFTKYRFWRSDSLGVQESSAVLLKIIGDTGDDNATPALGTGSTDAILGLSYGYESRKWYRWTALRYRRNAENNAGLQRGNKILFDLVGGIRPTPTGYLEPDTVWLLELNGEYDQRGELNGAELPNTGGSQWFLSPGIFWTLRNFAVKAGVQFPIVSNLNGIQDEADYRAKLILEWHL